MAPGALFDEISQNALAGVYSDTTVPAINITKQGSWDAILHRNARTTPLTLRSASGNWLEVSDGNKSWAVFDGSGGASVTCIGHKDYRVMKAEWDHFDSTGLTYAPSGSFRTEISEEFAALLIRTTNNMMAKVVFYGSGSEANEAAKKAAIQYHTREKLKPELGRTMFIARERSYHGATLGALGSSGHKSRREIFEPNLPKDTTFISACNPYRDMRQGMTNEEYVQELAQELEDRILEIGADKVAGFIAEPVVGAALGCAPAVPGYLIAMKSVCVKYGVLLILDEVMCGLGRTGYHHAWQEENVVPDIQMVGKGLAGGYAMISAVLFGHDIVNAFRYGPGNGAFAHGHTFQNFPRACAAGLKVQQIIEDGNLIGNVRKMGALLRNKLEQGLKYHPFVGDIRGQGLFLGIEFVMDKETKEPFNSLLNIAWRLHETGLTEDYGIYVYPGSGTVDGVKGDHIIISPAYHVTSKEVDTIATRVVKLIEGFFDKYDQPSPRL
ncbi:hypothetical protein HBI56_046540 [Parastagonospora nodorum]|uniref:Aminotransferase n=2 Tax=Phaeosphaeria nodorum (strain SN15 / ATCC MYA-4574 / FGSC 10173) TaxID=321614 RepID=A0A7U2ERS8_PHANO|nr:hypothetical protein SNOG_02020 [Parastagonospora nodorum SN15]KAH3916520.1 hypothetical protein HBH56_059680 [Parastagonospora nodorum]EAT90232.2 hypothetical protein SNOG_02020 [Parastagonospora nodorum SN15]KAH3930639.1 hypothetical protein HBH54_103610 [Parastagonospora nodorum]KAH3943784.1 hypothetical protein HBH53_165680 [Parastagonospora nodorum]KAH3965430.1 hypothetical protein HBH51_152350 [Parastagonospora nodorum]